MQMNGSASLAVTSLAKVNLYLRVGRRRADGFHSLVSWFCTVGLADDLKFTAVSGSEVALACDRAGVPVDGRNLVLKAAGELRPYAKRPGGLHIELRKRIPMGGGLGGGSSNAAAALKAIAQLWQCVLPADRLHEIAGGLGSDVPFFLRGPSAICRGRGELVSPLPPPVARGVLLILPGIEMPTPAVYRKFDEMGLGSDLAKLERELPDPNLRTEELLASLVNDLEAPAFAISAELAGLREEMERSLGRPVRMSGSGSTLFTLYDNEGQAAEAAAKIPSGIQAVACSLG